MIFDRFLNTHVIIRSQGSGAHFGVLSGVEGNMALLTDTRRIWYWDGAASLSELANKGPGKPDGCKFPAPIPEIAVYDVIEIIPCSPIAIDVIRKVPAWEENKG